MMRQQQEKETKATPLDEKQTTPHILQIEGNTRGCDHIVGDIHGSLATLKEALKEVKFENGDRFFPVGDLNDKGTHSLEVIEHIMAINQEYGKTVIYSVMGNHEQMLLDFYDAWVEYRDNPFSERAYAALQNATATSEHNGQAWATALAKSNPEKLHKIANYFKKLNYIIHVKATPSHSGFIVLHADLPFSQQELHQRIRDGRLMLATADKYTKQTDELNHTIWARKTDDPTYGGHAFSKKSANLTDEIVYCGHNVLEIRKLPGCHLDLDVATFLTDAVLLVNHNKKTVAAFSASDTALKFSNEINKVREHTRSALHLFSRLKMLADTLAAIKDPAERYEFNGQQFSYAELKPAEDKDSDLALFQQKVTALETFKKFAEENMNHEDITVSQLVQNTDDAWIKYVEVLAADFKKAPHANLANKMNNLMTAFSCLHVGMINGTTCYLTFSMLTGWLVTNNEVSSFRWDELGIERLFELAKNILVSCDLVHWGAFSPLANNLLSNPEFFKQFLSYCSDKLSRADIMTHLAPPLTTGQLNGNLRFFYHSHDFYSVLDQNNQFVELTTLSQPVLFSMLCHLCKEMTFDALQNATIWQRCIKNDDDLIAFLAYQPDMLPLIREKLLPALPFQAFDQPEKLAQLLKHFPKKYHLDLLDNFAKTIKHYHESTRSAFYLDLLKLRIAQHSDEEFAVVMQNIIELVEKTILSKKESVELIYFNLITIFSTSSSSHETREKVRLLLTEECCKLKLQFCNVPSTLTINLQSTLEKYFDVALPTDTNKPFSTIMMLAKDQQADTCRAIQTLLKKYNNDVKETKEVDMEATVQSALNTIVMLKRRPGFFGKNANPVLRQQYDELVTQLGILHVFIPPLLMPGDLACAYVTTAPKKPITTMELVRR